MKKRFIIFTILLSFLVCISSCGIKNTTSDSTVETEDNISSNPINTTSETGTSYDENQEDKSTEYEKSIVLWNEYLDTVVYLDEAGNFIKKVDIASDSNGDEEKDDSDIEYGDKYLVEAFGNYLIFSKYYSSPEASGYAVYAYDINSGLETELLKTTGFIKTDVYDGKLYIYEYDYNNISREIGFDLVTLEEISDLEIQGYEIVGSAMGHYGYTNYGSTARVRANTDFVLVSRAGSSEGKILAKFDGTYYETVFCSDDIYDVIAYDNDAYLAFVYVDSSYNRSIVKCDYAGTYFKHICSNYGAGSNVLGYKDGKLYYSVQDLYNYGVEEYTIYEYDMSTDSEREVYSAKKHPGMTYSVTPGVTGFTIVDDNIYYLADDGSEICWYTASCNDSNQTGTKIEDSSIVSYEWKNFGSVEYINTVAICPGCETATGKFYCEFFVLDDNLSPAANVINAKLFEHANLASTEMDVEFSGILVDTDNCEEHKMGRLVLEQYETVNSVNIFGNKYFQVKTSGIWYGGGVHGMPLMDSYIFDLNTGDKVYLTDIYQGSEEELSELIADKAVNMAQEDISEYGYTSFYTDNPDDIRDSVLSNITFDGNNVYFDENGATYFFAPYVVGPYASGFIEIFISYEELGISF